MNHYIFLLEQVKREDISYTAFYLTLLDDGKVRGDYRSNERTVDVLETAKTLSANQSIRIFSTEGGIFTDEENATFIVANELLIFSLQFHDGRIKGIFTRGVNHFFPVNSRVYLFPSGEYPALQPSS